MKFVVIGISGKQGAGKTTLANALNESLRGQFSTAHIIKFAQPLYDMADAFHEILGVTMKEKDGTLMQIVGNHARTKHGSDVFTKVWINNARQKLKDHLAANDVQYVICDDLRFDNEASCIKSFADSINGSCLLIRIEDSEENRKARIPSTWRENTNHPSEVGLDNYRNFDMTFNETTIEEMVRASLRKLGK